MKHSLGTHLWVTSFLACFLLFAMGHGALAQQYKWKLGHVSPPVHPWHLASVEFA
jgi:TRAP-type C4-dicarboxylate transport system substrate-binding protein